MCIRDSSLASRSAIAGLTLRRSRSNSLTDWRDTPIASARPVGVKPNSGKKSSRSISPGCVGLRCIGIVLGILIVFRRLSGSHKPQHRKHRRRQTGSRFSIGRLSRSSIALLDPPVAHASDFPEESSDLPALLRDRHTQVCERLVSQRLAGTSRPCR